MNHKFDEKTIRAGIQFGLGSKGIWTPELEELILNEIVNQEFKNSLSEPYFFCQCSHEIANNLPRTKHCFINCREQHNIFEQNG
jgi:hypothetical protein